MQIKSYLVLFLGFVLTCAATTDRAPLTPDQQLLKDVEILSSDAFEGRKTGTKGADMARVYLTKRFIEAGLKSLPAQRGFEQEFSFQSSEGKAIKGKNMLGYIPGKTDSMLVISAHYDHIGIIRGEIYNGADDNASGVAALLKMAAYFKKHKPIHTLIFAAFDAEEMGLQGARAFVALPVVALEKVKLNINMDMISHNDKGELHACGTFRYPQFKKYLISNNPKLKVLPGHDNTDGKQDDWTNQSDQAAFHAKNIPFIYFGVEDHKDYHKASDEYKNINKTFLIDAANAIQEITSNIDQERIIKK